jgi:imidazolonepropionase-like amidohydrolase
MGVTWVLRKAFYDTQRREQGLELHGADTPSDAAVEVLRGVLAGKVPLRIQARKQHDILAALRLAKEFDMAFTLLEATEAYKTVDELQETNTPVVFGPIYVSAPGLRAHTSEVDESRLYTFKTLLEGGVTTALTAHELRDEDGLAQQAMYARRMGISLEDATRAVCQTPARILGLFDEIGTVEPGKRADLVLWRGEPFSAEARPMVVLVGGEVVLDRRASVSGSRS